MSANCSNTHLVGNTLRSQKGLTCPASSNDNFPAGEIPWTERLQPVAEELFQLSLRYLFFSTFLIYCRHLPAICFFHSDCSTAIEEHELHTFVSAHSVAAALNNISVQQSVYHYQEKKVSSLHLLPLIQSWAARGNSFIRNRQTSFSLPIWPEFLSSSSSSAIRRLSPASRGI